MSIDMNQFTTEQLRDIKKMLRERYMEQAINIALEERGEPSLRFMTRSECLHIRNQLKRSEEGTAGTSQFVSRYGTVTIPVLDQLDTDEYHCFSIYANSKGEWRLVAWKMQGDKKVMVYRHQFSAKDMEEEVV